MELWYEWYETMAEGSFLINRPSLFAATHILVANSARHFSFNWVAGGAVDGLEGEEVGRELGGREWYKSEWWGFAVHIILLRVLSSLIPLVYPCGFSTFKQ